MAFIRLVLQLYILTEKGALFVTQARDSLDTALRQKISPLMRAYKRGDTKRNCSLISYLLSGDSSDFFRLCIIDI